MQRIRLVDTLSMAFQGLQSIEFVAHHDHGILVIEQPGSLATHEDWDVYAEGAHLDTDSLYVGILPTMEGPVTTSVHVGGAQAAPSNAMQLAYEGHVEVPNRVLLVGDSDRQVEIRVPTTSSRVGVAVWVDQVGLASRISVVLTDA